jgi:hypothetical protein
MRMVIDDKTRKRTCFWIYEAGPSKFQMRIRQDDVDPPDGQGRVLQCFKSREDAEKCLSDPNKRGNAMVLTG